jgi:2-(1,2-epoxy-1,2-dihydrophenyl)acetyl-CoA isomerase
MTPTPQPSAPVVLETREGAALTLTLNRPDRLNAMNGPLCQTLFEALRRAAADDAVRCVVLTGAGRAFCAGGDIPMMREARARRQAEELEVMLRASVDIITLMKQMPKPVVGAINGPAAGGGANLALACDIRIASEHASFGQSFAKIGLFPDYGGTWTLPRLVGPAVAAELLFTGELVHAPDALRLGMVNRVVPAGQLAAETRATVEHLLAAPPLAVRGIKQALFGPALEDLRRALEFEAAKQMECFYSEDAGEGMTAFVEKRKPNFKGK